MNKKYLNIVFIIILAILFVVISSFFLPKLKAKFANSLGLNYRRIVKINDKCGLQNKNGKFIIQPIYDQMKKTEYDLIVVIKNDKLGLFDKNGKIVLPPKYDANFSEYDFEFHEGLAAVIRKTKDGYANCIYIDKTGKEVLDPTKFGSSTVQDGSFGSCSEFSEGLAPATYNYKYGSNGDYTFDYGYINKQGKIMFKVDNIDGGMCGDALCISGFATGIAKVAIDGKFKYIDKTGKFVEKPQYDYIGEFSEGLAPADQNDKFGFVDKKGKFIIKPQYDYALKFSEGLAPVDLKNGWGYINKAGKIVIKPQFMRVKGFSEGLAPARLDDEKWGFIDKSGKFIIQPQFYNVEGFSDGEAYVEKAGNNVSNNKCYYIDKKGTVLYETCCN